MAKPQPITNVEQVLRQFFVSNDQLRTIKSALLHEFELGLSDEDKASVKMLITYVRELSSGDESGSYLALDLGGTHFRVLLVELNQGKAKVTTAVHDIPHELLVSPNGQELFDYIAVELLRFVQNNKLKRRRISLGFTFSFPCKQYGLTQSVLVKWCKGFNVGGVVGTDVVRQLKDALKRQLSGLVEAYIDVVAVINDTTGTLVACANSNPECRIGLIVGTGFNACYMERLDKCDKWPANYTSPKQVIINCEWGAMGDHPDRRQLDQFRNEYDLEVDAKSVNPLNQTYEKMVSGMYIGELLRLAIIKLVKAKALFVKANVSSAKPQPAAASAPGKGIDSARVDGQTVETKDCPARDGNNDSILTRLNAKGLLDGRHLSLLAKDEMSKSFEETRKIMQELSVVNYTDRDLTTIIQLGAAIMTRSANLVAVGISALLERMKRPFTVIGFDGSVIKYHPYFLHRLIDKCSQLTPPQFRFEFMMSSDGSGIGAAVVAAALHKERQPIYVVKEGKLYELHFTHNQKSS